VQILRIVLTSIFLAVVLSSGLALAQGCPQADGMNRVDAQTECLVIQTTKPSNIQKARNLLVYLHGDSSRGGFYVFHTFCQC
jgi:poly(3-hydroxybutyrate) depolymerase